MVMTMTMGRPLVKFEFVGAPVGEPPMAMAMTMGGPLVKFEFVGDLDGGLPMAMVMAMTMGRTSLQF